ncbi:hypothetical protein EVA_07218 [gut metagenome]|uniref:Uncharacterized protein n=1 Tax=gut metagenome TaxID=749906 RepID=J9GQE0_9ZZZZ
MADSRHVAGFDARFGLRADVADPFIIKDQCVGEGFLCFPAHTMLTINTKGARGDQRFRKTGYRLFFEKTSFNMVGFPTFGQAFHRQRSDRTGLDRYSTTARENQEQSGGGKRIEKVFHVY